MADKKKKKDAKKKQHKATDKLELVKLPSYVLQMPEEGQWSVAGLEAELLKRFPASDAESWDRTGLLVGDPAAQVTGVAIALDATVEAVQVAAKFGANVLLTHHPVFLDPPATLAPAGRGQAGPGTVVWEAISRGVALMNFHTALDVCDSAALLLPGMLGLDFRGIVDVVRPKTGRGYGQICRIRPEDDPFTLRRLSARCTAVFGRVPRVWGNFDARVRTVVTCTGSQGGLANRCVKAGVDALVCGEVRYHDALEASSAGLAIVELGHDVSELPLCAVLAAALESIGFPEAGVKILDQSSNWAIPEATRK